MIPTERKKLLSELRKEKNTYAILVDTQRLINAEMLLCQESYDVFFTLSEKWRARVLGKLRTLDDTNMRRAKVWASIEEIQRKLQKQARTPKSAAAIAPGANVNRTP